MMERYILIRETGKEATIADTPSSPTGSAEFVSETLAPHASASAHVEVTPSADTSHASARANPLGDGEEVCTILHY